MSANLANTENAAKLILHEAVSLLAVWSGQQSPSQPEANALITQAKQLANWPRSTNQAASVVSIQPLQLVFDRVCLDKQPSNAHYVPAITLTYQTLTLPYPTTIPPDLTSLQQQVSTALFGFTPQDWQNTGLLLATLEKYGSHVSLGGGDV